jgi:uncharacterized phage protein (TIGR02220 family)
MDAKWFKHNVGMSTDDKFRKIYRRHKEKFGWLNWMWGIVLESAAKDGGWFRQSSDVAHDEESLIVAFEWAYDVYGQEIIDLFILEYVKEGLITKDLLAFMYVTNWEKYQHAALSTPRVQEHRENKQLEADVTDVICELNRVTGKTFRAKTESHRQSIRGRFADGFTKEDMYVVIRHKQADWNNTKYAKHLTPDTLFRPGNFDRYLNEITKEDRDAIGGGTMLTVQNIYGKTLNITQEQFDAAESGFFKVIK